MNTNTLGKVVIGALSLFLWQATPLRAQNTHEKETTKTERVTESKGKNQNRSTHQNHQESARQAGHEVRSSQRDTSRHDDMRDRNGGRRLDDREFRGSFGGEHRFRPGWIGGGYNEFIFGGYTFGLLETWPIGWAYTDEVYVEDLDGGYVMVNPLYPGITVGLVIR